MMTLYDPPPIRIVELPSGQRVRKRAVSPGQAVLQFATKYGTGSYVCKGIIYRCFQNQKGLWCAGVQSQ